VGSRKMRPFAGLIARAHKIFSESINLLFWVSTFGDSLVGRRKESLSIRREQRSVRDLRWLGRHYLSPINEPLN
jgi:hypothetical protein